MNIHTYVSRYVLSLLAVVAVVVPVVVFADAPQGGTWTPTGSLSQARRLYNATLLPSGKVLVEGGDSYSIPYSGVTFISSAELYDPATDQWSSTGGMAQPRANHTATLLPDGRVLVAGGYGWGYTASAELYNPTTGTWSGTSPMSIARYGAFAVLLPNGKVLVGSGFNNTSGPGYISTAELYNPATGTWSQTGSLSTSRYGGTAVLLPNGKVLAAGGHDSDTHNLDTAELYDPSTGTWSPTASMSGPRTGQIAELLANGKVLVAGGSGNGTQLASAELYDPSTGTWSPTGSLSIARDGAKAVLTADGRVLVVGGFNSTGYLTSAELYDPTTGTWTLTGSMTNGRIFHTATTLNDGSVLVAGGMNDTGVITSSEKYSVPATVTTVPFSDDFNRPDSAVAGNGWIDSPHYTGRLSILNGRLTDAELSGAYATVYRPMQYSGPITVSADMSQENGYAGLQDRYMTQFFVNADGTGQGYGVRFERGDQNYPSYVTLYDNGNVISKLSSSFQYGPEIHAVMTFNPDGSITGTASQPGSSYDFSFPTRTVVSSGNGFSIGLGDGDPGAPGTPWVDNLQITAGAPQTNHAPVIAPIGNKSVLEGQTLTFTVSATDPDGDALTYSALNLPAGATFDPQTHVFTWTPSYGQAGNYPNVEFDVTDNGSPMALDMQQITISVGHVNRAPIVTPVGEQSVLEGQQLSFSVSATDPDGDHVVLSATNLPSGATFNAQTGVFAWTPVRSQVGSYVVTFTATDNGTPVLTGSTEVSITVGDNPTPVERSQDLIDAVVNYQLPKNVENSYLANLKKLPKFIENGQIDAAKGQVNAFISKLQSDYASHKISQAIYTDLLTQAQALLAVL